MGICRGSGVAGRGFAKLAASWNLLMIAD